MKFAIALLAFAGTSLSALASVECTADAAREILTSTIRRQQTSGTMLVDFKFKTFANPAQGYRWGVATYTLATSTPTPAGALASIWNNVEAYKFSLVDCAVLDTFATSVEATDLNAK